MFGILARTLGTVLRRSDWDAPDYWKQRGLMSDHDALENDLQRRRGHYVRVGQM